VWVISPQSFFVGVLLLFLGTQSPCAADRPEKWLTSCRQLRELSRAVAAQKLPVILTGVVSYVNAPKPYPRAADFILHDGEHGVYVRWQSQAVAPQTEVRVGQKLEVTGSTLPGGYAPIVVADSYLDLGMAALPPAQSHSLTELNLGKHDGQLVRVEGVVRRAHQSDNGMYRMELAAHEGRFSAFVQDREDRLPIHLVDAQLRLEGTCFMFFNSRGEGIGINIRLNGPEHVEVIKPAGTDPFSAPRVDDYTLNPFQPNGLSLHRQLLSGVVTLTRPGEFFYVQTPQRSYRVQTRLGEPLTAGDQVDVAGFVEQSAAYAMMVEAEFRKTARAPMPPPLPVGPADLLARAASTTDLRLDDYDGALVTTSGHLLKTDSDERGRPRLHVDLNGKVHLALLGEQDGSAARKLRLGSLLELTGVCVLQLDNGWPDRERPRPIDFHLLLRDITDVHVIAAPSWWTPQRLLIAVGVLGTALALILLWNFLLRRTVTAQTANIAERIASESRLEERQRIGRDFHDTLQQELIGIGMLIANSKQNLHSPDKASGMLNMAERMVQHATTESIRSIQDLMCVSVENGSLSHALEELVRPLAEMNGAQFEVDITGQLPQLAMQVETVLVRVVHEAVANAAKHANPSKITVAVDASEAEVFLSVTDDGVGFEMQRVHADGQRHFGLLGMRQRVLKVKGHLSIESAPGAGTSIRIRIPIVPRTASIV
jgi:signal transduction histidine kinase